MFSECEGHAFVIQPRAQMRWPPPASRPNTPLARRHGELCLLRKQAKIRHQFVCVCAVSESRGFHSKAGEPAPAAPGPGQLFQSPYLVRSRVVTCVFRDGNGPLACVVAPQSLFFSRVPQNMPASGPKHHELSYEVSQLLTDKREHVRPPAKPELACQAWPSSRKALC